MSVLNAMFGRSKNLGDIKITELQEEKIRLEIAEKSLSKQLREIIVKRIGNSYHVIRISFSDVPTDMLIGINVISRGWQTRRSATPMQYKK